MKSLLCTLLLLAGSAALSQQQSPPTTPPFTPDQQSHRNLPPDQQGRPDDQSPQKQIPPDTKAPAHDQMSSTDIQNQIQAAFDKEPTLDKTQLQTTVDDDSLTVSGTVENESQHQMALQIAQSYAAGRKVVDKVEVRKKA